MFCSVFVYYLLMNVSLRNVDNNDVDVYESLVDDSGGEDDCEDEDDCGPYWLYYSYLYYL